MNQLGYCCINQTLQAQGVFTGRTMRLATFHQPNTFSDVLPGLVIQNVKDLRTILAWNEVNNVWLFRMGSNFFPFWDKYDLNTLPNYEQIVKELRNIGSMALALGMRLTMHPDHFVRLGSSRDDVRASSIRELEKHHEFMTLLGLPTHKKFCLNIHVGQTNTPDVQTRFLRSLDALSDGCRARLVVENDDKATCFSVRDLHAFLPSDIPITFDFFHHQFHDGGLSTEDAAHLAASTWGDTYPLAHYSESKMLNEGIGSNPRAHADYVLKPFTTFGINFDIELEAKAKELALLYYRTIDPVLDQWSTPFHDFQRK